MRNKIRRALNRIPMGILGLPHFIIIGAQKSGTSTLYEHLCGHPQIIPSVKKEIHYFDKNYAKGDAWYSSMMPCGVKLYLLDVIGQKMITGEATPYYLFHPACPSRIARLNSRVKLIVLLRDPVSRAYSHYHHQVQAGRENDSFEEAIAQEPLRLAGEKQKILSNEYYNSYSYQHYSYLSRGRYAEQLEVWFKFFPREKILIISSEYFFSNTLKTLNLVANFLSIAAFNYAKKLHIRGGSYSPMNPETDIKLRKYFEPYNQKLYRLINKTYDW